MIVAHNLYAMNAQRQYGITSKEKSKSTEKLSSGYRINRSADDASGLAISEKMRRQIRGLNQGAENIKDGISLIQVADGALSEVHDMLNRMTELSVKAANGTLTADDRSYIQEEINALKSEIQRIADSTEFNEVNIFNDPEYYDQTEQPITKLLSCASANVGKMNEVYSANGIYYSAAYINFAGINSSNIDRLNGGSFSFNCGAGCREAFYIRFTTDGTISSADDLSGAVTHSYSIDISGCSNGAEIVDAIYDYVGNNLPSHQGNTYTDYVGTGLHVSHTNSLIKSGNQLIIVDNHRQHFSESSAKTYFIGRSGIMGDVSCSTIEAQHHDSYRDFTIQCSGEIEDREEVLIYRMNTNVLGIDTASVSTIPGAKDTVASIKNASAKISFQRSTLGAQQNRLEHTLRNNQNVSENTAAAESAIRDTNMADEIVHNSLLGVLEQAGISMLSQANQLNSHVLSLLQ